MDTDSVTLAIALAGYVPAGLAIRTLWEGIKEARAEAKDQLREGLQIDQSYASQLDSMALVLSSVQRTVSETSSQIEGRFDTLEKTLRAAFRQLVLEVRKAHDGAVGNGP